MGCPLLAALPSPLIAGPIHSVETANMTTKIASAISGAVHVPNRRLSRSNIGIVNAKPIAPNNAATNPVQRQEVAVANDRYANWFCDVDRSANPANAVAYLDAASGRQPIAAMKQRTLEMLAFQPGERVLEVGCGAGVETLAMARAVAPGGRAVGSHVVTIATERTRRPN
jgi:hypothetical protein